jgi:purine-binding chemotaxis protein CheW
MAKPKRGAAKRLEPPAAGLDSPDSSAPELDLITFRCGAEHLAFPLGETAEIIRLPALAKMPLGPPSLLGLANLRGTVVPVVSMRRLLGFDDSATTSATRVIVMAGATPLGFAVDGIDRLMSVPVDGIEEAASGSGAIDLDVVEGIVKGREGADATKILNATRLLQKQFATWAKARTQTTTPASISPAALPQAAQVSNHLPFVSFELNRQEYALPLADVREIIPLPNHISEVARAESAVLGVVTLRDKLLPIVSLRALLGLAAAPEGEPPGKVVVLALGETHVGVVADRTREILRVDPATVDPAPALLTRGAGDAEIISICRLDGGRRLVAVLAPDRLFRSELMARIAADHGSSVQVSADSEIKMTKGEQQFVVFRLGAQEYGMPIAMVDEIARIPKHLTKMPKSPAFVDGVINLRGSVVPVIDLRRRFDVPATAESDRHRILVLAFAGGKTGFLVDEVSEVIKIEEASIQTAPELSEEQMRLVGRVANLGDQERMILLVDAPQLLDQVETDVLEKFDRNQADKVVSHS